jgi:diphosphomevalonate decarboxylase
MLARLGSGSASRSVYGGFSAWGTHHDIPESSNKYAIPISFKINEQFAHLKDSILLIEKNQKSVSSSAGHDLMNTHIFAANRIEAAKNNMSILIATLQNGDWNSFGKIVEGEALMLHALMMSSNPPYLLMKPGTVAVIEKIWEYRNNSKANIYFTLDAGANVHVIYPKSEAIICEKFIEEELSEYCKDKSYICDEIGNGPEKVLI